MSVIIWYDGKMYGYSNVAEMKQTAYKTIITMGDGSRHEFRQNKIQYIECRQGKYIFSN